MIIAAHMQTPETSNDAHPASHYRPILFRFDVRLSLGVKPKGLILA
jgi:hypothetical protein